MTNPIRTEIIRFEKGGPCWSVDTVRGKRRKLSIELSMLPEDWRPGDKAVVAGQTFPFEQARDVAIGILRAVYYEMPVTWHLADRDPTEYLAHLLEIIYDMTPDRKASRREPIHNLLSIESHMTRQSRLIGKARKRILKWKRRWENTARWARINHKRVVEQREQLRIFNEKELTMACDIKCHSGCGRIATRQYPSGAWTCNECNILLIDDEKLPEPPEPSVVIRGPRNESKDA